MLLVEDEVEIQCLLERSLTEAGYHVGAAGDAAESLAIGEKYDVLIVDLGWPDQDSITLITGVRL